MLASCATLNTVSEFLTLARLGDGSFGVLESKLFLSGKSEGRWVGIFTLLWRLFAGLLDGLSVLSKSRIVASCDRKRMIIVHFEGAYHIIRFVARL